MRRLLRRAGVVADVLRLVPNIAATCAACRNWIQPQPASVASVENAEGCNLQVECDSLVAHNKIVFHWNDKSMGWHHAMIVKDRFRKSLISRLAGWCLLYGPKKKPFTDGESGLDKPQQAKDYSISKDITLVIRAPERHAKHIETYCVTSCTVLSHSSMLRASVGCHFPRFCLRPSFVATVS